MNRRRFFLAAVVSVLIAVVVVLYLGGRGRVIGETFSPGGEWRIVVLEYRDGSNPLLRYFQFTTNRYVFKAVPARGKAVRSTFSFRDESLLATRAEGKWLTGEIVEVRVDGVLAAMWDGDAWHEVPTGGKSGCKGIEGGDLEGPRRSRTPLTEGERVDLPALLQTFATSRAQGGGNANNREFSQVTQSIPPASISGRA